jgi:Cys-tRNA(Pro)/Cys-tRNA(Cys) deacylase
MRKTQAMRMLEQRGIAFEPTVYDADSQFHSGADAAALLGVDAGSVYKTLVVVREDREHGKPMLVMIPSEDELDLKLLARATGAKKLQMASHRDAERLTGMQAGGISALAVRPAVFDVLIDERALALAVIHVSAGQRGIDLALRPADLMEVTGARAVRLSG